MKEIEITFAQLFFIIETGSEKNNLNSHLVFWLLCYKTAVVNFTPYQYLLTMVFQFRDKFLKYFFLHTSLHKSKNKDLFPIGLCWEGSNSSKTENYKRCHWCSYWP